MAVLSFPVLMFVCVFITCVALILTWGGGSISNICISLPQPCKCICEKTLFQIYPKWPPFLSSQILPVTLTSVRGEKKQRQIVGSELTCVSKRHQQCSVSVLGPWPLTLTPPICLTSTWVSAQPSDPERSIGFAFKMGRRLCLQLRC